MEIKWIKRRGKTRREEKGRTEQRGEKTTTEGKGGGGGASAVDGNCSPQFWVEIIKDMCNFLGRNAI